ncbi:MAG: alanine--tRNA ligase [Phycisphaerales bacterium]|nr:MAG: alanine--tRNA ligase [Phycisphaerales bacterium]
MKAAEIRQDFIAFFEGKEHTFVPSAPVVPIDDPTLMFTNAGMNQFKDIFLGHGSRPYRRAANTQKCIRVSGKHNDLEEVGRDTYHHTFFEMLGNWSFGDYFKAEAIEWAWELLTDVWGLPKDRFYATVFEGSPEEGVEPDREAEKHWIDILGPDRVFRFGKKDNFWEMGETGPCGPCSEIHYDLTPDKSGAKLVNAGRPQVIEIWNLVFIQYNRGPDGSLTPLPAKHVDTGMGFERLVALLQNAGSNYDTDLFAPIMAHIAELTGKSYTRQLGNDVDNAFRVVADHLRMLTFAIADGATPSNEGRGYVLRRLVRRAARFGRQHLEQSAPFIHKLVPTLADVMGRAFPEIAENAGRVTDIIRDEEESFGRTIDRGIARFNADLEVAQAERRDAFTGEEVWDLYQTYGFPADLTRQMAEEKGLKIDEEDFERLREEAREKARAEARSKATAALAFSGTLPATDDRHKHESDQGTARVLGWIAGNKWVDRGNLAEPDGEVGIVLDRTCFYAEQGGQVGDAGIIQTTTGTFDVDDTQRLGDGIVHIGHVGDGHLEAGQDASVTVDPARSRTRKNHTATHLLHWALREILGQHVTQRGSLVEPDRLRFDFDHNRPVTREEVTRIEKLVNDRVLENLPIQTLEMPTEQARRLPGVRAFFGEKYGPTVRVVTIGDGFSREFCGGTHLDRTGRIGIFKIVGEESVAKGVRRIAALTGPRAVDHLLAVDRIVSAAAAELNVPPDQVPGRVAALKEEIKKLQKQIRSGGAVDLVSARQELFDASPILSGTRIVVGEMPSAPVEKVRECLDWFRDRAGSAAILVGQRAEGRVTLLAAMSDDLVAKGLRAGELVRDVAPTVAGRGGGKPELAQAGGKDPDALPDALRAARAWIEARLAAEAAPPKSPAS